MREVVMNRRFVFTFGFVGILVLIWFFFTFDLYQYVQADYLLSQQGTFCQFYKLHTGLSLLFYFFVLIILTTLSIPGLSIIIILGASIFSIPIALILTSLADVLGSTCAFLGSRHVLKSRLEQRYAFRLQAVNQGLSKDGALYLIFLRLMPVFPCLLINLLMGLTRMRIKTFFWATQLGKLPRNTIFIYIGSQFSRLNSIQDVSPLKLSGSLLLLALIPLLAKNFFNEQT
jgi:uncharacterized membrane protein YdjX (TVP38/TMEM64 family)